MVGTTRENRRAFLAQVLAGIGLLASYGVFAGYAVAYLFPKRARQRTRRLYIGRRDDVDPARPRQFVDQKGRTLLIRVDDGGLTAFDTRCPHLGCKVHWEAEKTRFFCPCHNGVFDRRGVAVSGPPADAGQSLARVPLEVDESGNVFLHIEA